MYTTCAATSGLNRKALGWLNRVATARIHGTTGVALFERLTDERLTLIYDKPDYDTSHVNYRRCSHDCLISDEGNYLSVPADYAGQCLVVKVTERGELSRLDQRGDVIAWHPLAIASSRRVVVAEHHKDLHLGSGTRGRVGALQQSVADLTPRPWLEAPIVEVRPLGAYQDLAEVES